ncbi:MAG: response regulator transcription factor [Spirochaetaceae bacterium]|nr:response regulator transcription factor [Spirochaetaceae bacterium]
MTPILIVDDELQIRKLLRLCLEKNDFVVFEADSGAEGLRQFAGAKPDIVILDLGLPDMDGRDILREIRSRGETPVIVLSVRDAEAEIMELLDAGADDYLTKPFGTGELLARIRVAIRHRTPQSFAGRRVRVGAIEIDMDTREAYREGAEEKLTPTEWSLLLAFLRNAGKIMTRNQILREVWGPNLEEEYNSLRVYINQLRKKIEIDPAVPSVLLTEPGVGYRLKVQL